jgi:hypothetical protein
MPESLMETIRFIDEIPGVRIAKLRSHDDVEVFRLSVARRHHRLNVLTRRRAPYLNELDLLVRERKDLAEHGIPMLHVPYMPETTGHAFSRSGWSWVDDIGNFYVRADELLLQRRVSTKSRVSRRFLSGRAAIAAVRILASMHTDETVGASELARKIGTSQPRASQILAAFAEHGIVRRADARRYAPYQGLCIDAFVEHYRGPQGETFYFYALESPLDVALKIARTLPLDAYAISADVGPDLLAPIRRPSHLVAYLRDVVSLTQLRWTKAKGRDDANVIVYIPADDTVFSPKFQATVTSQTIALAHPTQMLWDLLQLGGDRKPAYDSLLQWTLRSH